MACLGSILDNKSTLQLFAIYDRVVKVLSDGTKKELLCDAFWKGIIQIHTFLKPVADWIIIIEGDAPQISLVPTIFKDLNDHFEQCLNTHSPENKIKIMLFLKNRKKFCITSLHYAVNLLDPMLHGKCLTNDEELQGIECIAKIA